MFNNIVTRLSIVSADLNIGESSLKKYVEENGWFYLSFFREKLYIIFGVNCSRSSKHIDTSQEDEKTSASC